MQQGKDAVVNAVSGRPDFGLFTTYVDAREANGRSQRDVVSKYLALPPEGPTPTARLKACLEELRVGGHLDYALAASDAGVLVGVFVIPTVSKLWLEKYGDVIFWDGKAGGNTLGWSVMFPCGLCPESGELPFCLLAVESEKHEAAKWGVEQVCVRGGLHVGVVHVFGLMLTGV